MTRWRRSSEERSSEWTEHGRGISINHESSHDNTHCYKATEGKIFPWMLFQARWGQILKSVHTRSKIFMMKKMSFSQFNARITGKYTSNCSFPQTPHRTSQHNNSTCTQKKTNLTSNLPKKTKKKRSPNWEKLKFSKRVHQLQL